MEVKQVYRERSKKGKSSMFKMLLPLIVCCLLAVVMFVTLMVGQRQPRRWDADYDYLRADYFADYGAEDYEDNKEVIVREKVKKHNKKNFTSHRNKSEEKDEFRWC